MNGVTQTGVVRAKTRDALLRYCNWLSNCKFVEDDVLKTMCLQFERYDGNGLPYGLKDEQIPELSENWAMAQVYSSKLHSKPRHPRVDGRTAGEHLVSQSGRAFNGKRINNFLTKIGFYPQGSLVELNDKRLAVVIRQNEAALLKPQVQTVDLNGGAVGNIDLQSTPELYVTRQVMEY
jgi:HD-GYP domain-containing protein (c-di-GMP phosphodiesterase class II)